MQETCHRCGGELPAGSGESPFCPHCGAPQLRLSMDEQTLEQDEAGVASTGALPPPRPRQVDWKAAIRCALLVSSVAAVLSLAAARVEVLSTIMLLWVLSASLIALSLYQRLRPTAWMDVRVGARIGMVVGMFLAIALGAATAGWGVLSRYVLHSMGGFDTDMAAQLKHALLQIPPDKAGFFLSPEFRGGIMAAAFATTSAALLVLCTVGGAFAGLLRMRRGPAV